MNGSGVGPGGRCNRRRRVWDSRKTTRTRSAPRRYVQGTPSRMDSSVNMVAAVCVRVRWRSRTLVVLWFLYIRAREPITAPTECGMLIDEVGGEERLRRRRVIQPYASASSMFGRGVGPAQTVSTTPPRQSPRRPSCAGQIRPDHLSETEAEAG